jgi:hypothetical protein
MKRVLSLGAGVQSSTVFMMSCLGELPRLDAAVFADTGWEPKAVYEYFEWLKEQGEKYGIPIHIVSNGNVKKDCLEVQVAGKKKGRRFGSMPLHTGKGGIVRRTCTDEYKIRPLEAFVKYDLMGWKKGQRQPKELVCQRWFGISADEPQRMRQPKTNWETYYYPLCGVEFSKGGIHSSTDMKIKRRQCLEWMESRGFPQPPRSSCIGCPFHSDAEWRHLRDSSPAEFQEAVEFDKKIRQCAGMRHETFLHRTAKPLGEVDLNTPEDLGQQSLWGNECEGMCGL